MALTNFHLLRDPVSGEPLIGYFHKKDQSDRGGLTGVLRGSTREYPVLDGIVVFREDVATETITTYAREGRLAAALFEALRIEKRSRRAAMNLLLRLKYPRALHLNGSPYGGLSGAAGTYFRYRYSVPNVPAIIGALSCLKRSPSPEGYVLDVGSGFAHFYRYYLHAYPAEKIVLVDHSLEALVTASRFIDHRTLLVCCDADYGLPLQKRVFSDITSFNAFQYFNAKERFVENAIEALDAASGTLWLTNNWNPKLTDQFFGPARTPSEWQAFCSSDKWRIFPEKHLTDPVLRGGLVNLGLRYVPQDDHPAWRCVTLVYSNVPWDVHTKFLPLNRTPKWQHLCYNSIYDRSAFSNRLLKRNIQLKFWDAHRE